MKKPSQWTFRQYAGIAAGLLLLVLLFQNRHPVTLYFLWGKFDLSMLFFLPLVFVGGMVAGYAIRRKQHKSKEEKKEDPGSGQDKAESRQTSAKN